MYTSADIVAKATAIRNFCKERLDFQRNPIDDSLSPVAPFWLGNKDIKVFLIGQDPTIRNKSRRNNISCTLNLDKTGSLKRYIAQILEGLGLSEDQVYATNLFKYFYTRPPAETIEVLQQHLFSNLELLNRELLMFPNAIVITLGEPLLKLIVRKKPETLGKMTRFWDYDFRKRASGGNFSFLSSEKNLLERDIFPLPHQPSLSKAFYKSTFEAYINFIRRLNEERLPTLCPANNI